MIHWCNLAFVVTHDTSYHGMCLDIKHNNHQIQTRTMQFSLHMTMHSNGNLQYGQQRESRRQNNIAHIMKLFVWFFTSNTNSNVFVQTPERYVVVFLCIPFVHPFLPVFYPSFTPVLPQFYQQYIILHTDCSRPSDNEMNF